MKPSNLQKVLESLDFSSRFADKILESSMVSSDRCSQHCGQDFRSRPPLPRLDKVHEQKIETDQPFSTGSKRKVNGRSSAKNCSAAANLAMIAPLEHEQIKQPRRVEKREIKNTSGILGPSTCDLDAEGRSREFQAINPKSGRQQDGIVLMPSYLRSRFGDRPVPFP